MTREQAREHINNLMSSQLTRAKRRSGGHDTYICPFCGNGSGEDGDGICTRDGKHYTCFKGCFMHIDYLDILKKQNGTDNENDIFKLYSLTIDGRPSADGRSHDKADEQTYDTSQDSAQTQALPAATVNYIEYFNECNARAGQTDYFSFRGITPEKVGLFNLGYDPSWRHPKTPNAPATSRIIIPTGDGRTSYLARAVSNEVLKQYQKQKVGGSELFNAAALENADGNYVFIVEGEFDALSVIEAGGQAVALGSTSNVEKFLAYVSNARTAATLVLSLDKDETGQRAQAHIKDELKKLKISFLEVDISGAYEDPNDAWVNDEDRFTKFVSNPCKESHIEENSWSRYIAGYVNLTNERGIKRIPTGFKTLDDVLGGGLHEGLYILGAMSSIGKTSIVLQIANQIAQQGIDVLFFSLEMSGLELLIRSMSRLTYNIANQKKNAATVQELYNFVDCRDKQKELIITALADCERIRDTMYIHEGVGDIGAERIKETVKRHIQATGNKPVVFIDYLQMLEPYEIRATDKQNTDKAVLALKKLSREHKIPVLAISSFNRENYRSPVSMTAFKESGAIEYSSDVLMGLQFQEMDEIPQGVGAKTEADKQIEEMNNNDPRKMEVVILKNRNGVRGAHIPFNYHPAFNYFQETQYYKRR